MKSISNRLLLILAVFLLLGGGISQLFAQTRTVTRVAAEGTVSYFVLDDGSLWGAGNYQGSSGNAATYPARITTGVKDVFATRSRAFFLKTDGTLWAFGYNSSGEFGNGTQTDSYQPIQVATDVVSVAPGSNHTLFLKADATLWATGDNSYGQLGTGQTSTRPTLKPIQIVSGVRSIAAGTYVSFFIKTDGSLWGMGYNGYGTFGIGQNSGGQNYVSPLSLGLNVSTASVLDRTAIRISSSALSGSGVNASGMLGPIQGYASYSDRLIQSGVSKAFLGNSHLLSLKSDGSLWANGNNEWSQFGNGTLTSTTTPIQIATGVAEAAAGAKHSFYLKTDGSLWAMGYNQYGELADGTTTERNTAIKLTQPAFTRQPAALSVSVGASAAFTPTVTSTGAATYQWFKDGSAITGATTITYTIASTTAASAGNYALVATNWLGSTTSTVAALTVISPVSITTQPTAQTVIAGNTATFSVVATGSAPVQTVAIPGLFTTGVDASNALLGNNASDTHYVVSSIPAGAPADNAGTSRTVLSTALPGGWTPNISTARWITTPGTSGNGRTDGGNDPWRGYGAFDYTLTFTMPAGANLSSVSITGACASDDSAQIFVNGILVSGQATGGWGSTAGFSLNSSNATFVSGSNTITFRVDNNGGGPTGLLITSLSGSVAATQLGYQWSKDGVAISGATAATYSIAATTAANAGSYSVIVTNSVGSVTSAPATLTVNPAGVAPSITTQPTSQSVTAGSTITFSVVATGTSPVSYQWRKNGVTITGATSASLTFSSAAASDAGSYSVVVANALGSINSDVAVLTVNTPPTITVQPSSQTVVAGAPINLSVTATGTGTLTYQWYSSKLLYTGLNNYVTQTLPISGGTSANLVIASSSSSDTGSYYVVVSTTGARVTSSSVSITVNTPPSITSQPVSSLTYSGTTYSLAVSASGTSPLNYQWYKDGTAINGAISSSYALTGNTLNKAGSYYVVITNVAGSVTSNSTTVVTPPLIITQPGSTSVTAGNSTSFAVGANGSPTLTYQWYKNSSRIAGAIGSSYTFTSAATTDAGGYAVVVSNAYGTATSSTVTLTVTPAPSAPTITTQPASQNVISSFSSTFSVSASGTAPFTYVWRKDGSTVVGGNSSSLTLNNITSANAGNYTVTITNSIGSVTSTAATLTVNDPATTFTQRKRTSGSSNSLWSFAYGNGTMVAVGSPGLLYTSTDGVTWTQRASGTNEWLVGVAYGNNQFVAVGDNGRILRSSEGILWTYAANEGTIFRLNGVIYAGDRWVAVGENGVIVTSTDANTWSPVLSGTTRFLHGLAYYEGCFIATGGSGTILSSPDGLTWTARNSGTTNDLEACAVVGNYFMAVGSAGECLFSYVKLGGSTWTNNTKYKPNTTARLRGLASGAGAAIAFTDSGTAFYLPSIYGNWTQLPLSTSTTYLTAGFAQNRFYGLGTGEVIVQSEPFFAGRLGNLSTRGQTGLGGDVLISGLVVTGSSPKQMLIRAAGPALTNFGVSGALNKPILTLFDSTGTAIASNTGWNQSPNDSDIRSASIAAGAFAFPENSADSAMLIRLLPGSYTAQVTGVNNTTGTTLIETYDMESVQTMQSKLINISSRGVVGSGQNIIIPGISVGGSSSRILLIRAVGPTLGAFGVTGTLSNPTISVVQTVNGINTTLATNDDWESQNSTVTFTAAEVRDLSTKAGAFTLPSGSKDAALLFSTSTNTSYTVLVSGSNGETGVALVEVYDVTGL
jgi:alpha-tubulin suppressor-like RCC1 family protein